MDSPYHFYFNFPQLLLYLGRLSALLFFFASKKIKLLVLHIVMATTKTTDCCQCQEWQQKKLIITHRRSILSSFKWLKRIELHLWRSVSWNDIRSTTCQNAIVFVFFFQNRARFPNSHGSIQARWVGGIIIIDTYN